MTDLRTTILSALQTEQIPGLEDDVVSAGMIRALSVEDGQVSFVLEAPDSVDRDALRDRLITRIKAIAGVQRAVCYISAQTDAPAPDPGQASGPRKVAGVDRVILVGSGKGGVGKSTVTTNLALALADRGLRVGVLDADIYGPSVPHMMGTSGRPVSYDGHLIPIAAHGIKLISVGLMMDPDEALVWRGPILANTLAQLLHEVRWDPLDVLLIDLPPGTGDVQITLAQEAELSGAIVVTTPQKVALNDARRAVDLFRRTDTPILGIVENMSTHICNACGSEEQIFGTGGADTEAERLGLPVIARLPLEPDVCQAGEAGTPVVRAAPNSVSAKRFADLAEALSR